MNRLNRLPCELIQRIVEFYIEPIYQLLDWISKEHIDMTYIYKHPHAMDLVQKDIHYINWENLSRNPNAISLLEANQDKINWFELSGNPNAIPLLEANID